MPNLLLNPFRSLFTDVAETQLAPNAFGVGGKTGRALRSRQISTASEGSVVGGTGASLGGTVGNGKRKCKNPIPDDDKDDKYWRRRYKNNIAARR